MASISGFRWRTAFTAHLDSFGRFASQSEVANPVETAWNTWLDVLRDAENAQQALSTLRVRLCFRPFARACVIENTRTVL